MSNSCTIIRHASPKVHTSTFSCPISVSAVDVPTSSANYDILARLRDCFLFDDFVTIEQWLGFFPDLAPYLFDACSVLDDAFGTGRVKWLSVVNDWEGSTCLNVDVEFAGTGEQANMMLRGLTRSWFIHQPAFVREKLSLGIRFV